jgi:uncharacterized UPF0160 family protein
MPVPVADGLRIYRNPNKIPQELCLGDNANQMNTVLGLKNGVMFSHKMGFFGSCKNKEAAEKFLEYCVKK